MKLTPLPKPVLTDYYGPMYFPDQMKAYGAAEYKRAIDDAAKVCTQAANESGSICNGLPITEQLVLRGAQAQAEKLAASIIQLKEKS